MRRLSRWMMGALVLLAAYGAAAWALSPVWPDIGIAASVVALVLALWVLHRALIKAEDRGWIHYRRKRGSYGGLGVTSEFLNMYDPTRRYLQQTVRERDWKRAEDDDGDPPGEQVPSGRVRRPSECEKGRGQGSATGWRGR